LVGEGARGAAAATLVPPPPRIGATEAFDPITNAVILFGGSSQGGLLRNDTWAWDGGHWRRLA
jgi:hypothetical protein